MAWECKSIFVKVFIIFLCFFAVPFKIPKPKVSEERLLFKSYTNKFNKSYSLNSSEYEIRFQNFKVRK